MSSKSLAPTDRASPLRSPVAASRAPPALAEACCAGWVRAVSDGVVLAGRFLRDDHYWLPLFTRYMALALFALSVDLIWGYTGLLSLGQGLFFGIGVYAVGYSLMFQKAALDHQTAAAAGVRTAHAQVPSAVVLAELDGIPGSTSGCALAVAVLLPALMAGLFGSGRRSAAHQGRLFLAAHPGSAPGHFHHRRQTS